MWVMIALFWANTEGNDLDRWFVYKDQIFNSYTQCQTTLLDNRDEISYSLGNLNISNRFSVKCIDATEYPEVMSLLKMKSV
jgi:hypothetical protein